MNLRVSDLMTMYMFLCWSNTSNLGEESLSIVTALREFSQEDQSYLCEENDLIRVKSPGNEPTDSRDLNSGSPT